MIDGAREAALAGIERAMLSERVATSRVRHAALQANIRRETSEIDTVLHKTNFYVELAAYCAEAEFDRHRQIECIATGMHIAALGITLTSVSVSEYYTEVAAAFGTADNATALAVFSAHLLDNQLRMVRQRLAVTIVVGVVTRLPSSSRTGASGWSARANCKTCGCWARAQ